MAVIATANFRGVDRLLQFPAPAAVPGLERLGHDSARTLLRYEASEFNRQDFEIWEMLQIGLGVLLFFLLLFGTHETKFALGISLIMLLIALLQRIWLTPAIVSLGRAIDFVPVYPPTAGRADFRVLHAAYVGLELAKWALGALLAVVVNCSPPAIRTHPA